MSKILEIVAELEYDDKMIHGDEKEAIDWFYNYILKDDKLILHSNEIGDYIG